MCGFFGGVYTRPVDYTDVESLRAGVRALRHRGPDSERVELIPEARAVLGFARLVIIDREGGEQPMHTGRGQHLLFNGEIYNYRELRPRLQRSVPLQTRSDTEVLLWELATRGTSCMADLVGMFGFAYLDVPGQTLLLARDRLGIKQVYYTQTEHGFFFASEPKALLHAPGVSRRLDEEQLAGYFGFRAVPAPHTLFSGIRKLPPGSVLRYSLVDASVTVEQFWSVPSIRPSVPWSEALDRFEAVFLEAVRSRLVADVPVGAFLSGGLDSSLVVAAMRRLEHPELSTFSATFPGYADDEGAFARRVAQRFGTRHFELATNPATFLHALPGWVNLNDDLVADASCLPLLAVSKLARECGCIVLLSGEGSDELFAGYGSYHKFVGLNRLHRLLAADSLRRGAFAALSRSGLFQGQDRFRVAEYLVAGGAFMGTAALLGTRDLNQILSAPYLELPRAAGRSLADLCAFDFRTRIPEDLMVRTDRATAGASIEARVPFLDHRLVELTFSLPSSLRSVPALSKVLPRMLARRWGVPIQTIVHRKIGFHLPLGDWFRNDLAGLWHTILEERVVPGINYDFVATVARAHIARTAHFEELLWRVAALELWYRHYVLGLDSEAVLSRTIPHATQSSMVAA